MKKILVLMSSYNGEKYIEAQIESIFNQTISNCISLRIRDDGSSDSTVDIIRMLSDRNPAKIELIEGNNIGYNASFYELINGAGGSDYYAFSDQDDVWLPSKLEVAIDTLSLEDDTIPLLYASTSYLVRDDLVPYGQTRRKQRPFTIFNTAIQNICPGHTQVFNNALLKVIQDKNIDTDKLYVYDSWVTNHAVLYGKILFNNSSFTYYRQHKSNNLGSGVGKLGQLIASIKRSNNGDGHKYHIQVEYLVDKNKEKLVNLQAYEEFNKLFEADNIVRRVKWGINNKLYRQNRFETLTFYLGVILGYY